jgi:TIR domain/WD40-like Beta Propeller Repeat
MPTNKSKTGDEKKLPGIFISYRRSDTPDAVGRIYDRLIAEFGKARVFKDVDSIPLGQDFRGHLNDIVGGCATVLAIIGPKWTDIRNEAGQKRLDDPDDFVRIELEAALARNVPVVPVLVGHAPMPGTSQLPSTLSSLAFRQSIEVRPDPDFHNDATRLVSALKAIIDPNAPTTDAASGMHMAPDAPSVEMRLGRRLKWTAATAATAMLAAAALAVPALKHLREIPPPETRVEISTPATEQPADFALSPDGRQIVFAAESAGESRLWLRPLSTTAATLLPGTEGATSPFWSPDSRSIGFFAQGMLKRLDLQGGLPQSLAPVSTIASGTWNAAGVILFARGPGDPLSSIAATGGKTSEVTKLGPGGVGHRFPLFLPGGHRFLFLSITGTAPGIYLGSLDGGAPIRVTTDQSRFAFLPSGWMLWIRSGALMAQRLDVDKAILTGEPVTLADNVDAVSAGSTGLLAYRNISVRQRQLTWVDRSGKTLGVVGDPDETLLAPRVAPDGRRVAVSRVNQGNDDIWLLDGARASRMTFDPAADEFPAWSRDGSRIAFTSNR